MYKSILCSCVLLIFGLVLWSYRKSPLQQKSTLVDSRINLRYIPGFLSLQECDHLINLSQNKFSRSKVVTIDKDDTYNSDRTSSSYYVPRANDDVVSTVESKASQYFGKSVNHMEELQVVRYLEGQEFKEHHDWFNPDYLKKLNGNQRLYTIFVYLNDVEEGGETYFPQLGKSFVPKKGDAIFWENCKGANECYAMSLHQGKPPKKGVKYGLNIWCRFEKL